MQLKERCNIDANARESVKLTKLTAVARKILATQKEKQNDQKIVCRGIYKNKDT